MNIGPNLAKGSLTSSTSFLNYLTVIDYYSQYFMFIGLKFTQAKGNVQAVNYFAVHHRPHMDFFPSDVKETHADAGTAFLLDEFQNWAHKHSIDVMAAAPHHQEIMECPRHSGD